MGKIAKNFSMRIFIFMNIKITELIFISNFFLLNEGFCKNLNILKTKKLDLNILFIFIEIINYF